MLIIGKREYLIDNKKFFIDELKNIYKKKYTEKIEIIILLRLAHSQRGCSNNREAARYDNY